MITLIKCCGYIYLHICRCIFKKLETTVKNCNDTCTDYRKPSQERRDKQVIFIIGLFGENLIKKNCKYRHPNIPSIYLWSHPPPTPPKIPHLYAELSSKGSLHKEKFTEIQGTSVQIQCGCLIISHIMQILASRPEYHQVRSSILLVYLKDNQSIKKWKYKKQFNVQETNLQCKCKPDSDSDSSNFC